MSKDNEVAGDREIAKRLAVLDSYGVLDTPPEDDFDDIVRLASLICGTPIALVSLVTDSRQFFKARQGLDATETPIASSFCARALPGGDVMVVADATADPRFADNPLVVGEPHIRFYAGAVLTAEDGTPYGTVCVIDDKPREITEAQKDGLRLLARQTMKLMQLRQSLGAREEDIAGHQQRGQSLLDRAIASELAQEEFRLDNERSRLAQEAGGIGTFELDVRSGVMTVSPEFCRIFGMEDKETFHSSIPESIVLQEDSTVRSSDTTRTDGTAKLQAEYRIRRPSDGAIRWILRHARFVRGEKGLPDRMYGIVSDITAQKVAYDFAAALLKLGDRLSDATSIEEVAKAAGEILGESLAVGRAGYAVVDAAAETFTLDGNWLTRPMASMNGVHAIAHFPGTISRLRSGSTLIVKDVRSFRGLESDVNGYRRLGVRSFVKVPLLRGGELVGCLFVHASGERPWNAPTLAFIRGVADRTYAAIAKLTAEADQKLLNSELSHRLKNTLTMVQAIANQTLKTVTDKDAVDAFNSRLIALSTAHDVLLQQSWASARMQLVVADVLGLHGEAERFAISGPDILLGPRATLSLSLLLHELATNAVKYGALSVRGGIVNVNWSVQADGVRQMLTLNWKEQGGPAAGEPKRKGFGSRLINLGLEGTGGATVRYLPTGLEAEFIAPLARLQQS